MQLKNKYNSLVLIKFISLKEKSVFKCDCGNICELITAKVLSGAILNCGCIKIKQKGRNIKHGMRHTRFYKIWKDMRKRCRETNLTTKSAYFDRGIKVCERWEKFDNFFSDMFLNYADNLTIERINNDLGYSLENCKWILFTKQSHNRRTTRYVVYKGKKYCLAELVTKFSQNYGRVHARLKNGWSIEEAIETI